MKLDLYIPSMHGDILLKSIDDKRTTLRFFALSETEAQALDKLRTRAISEKWASVEDFDKVPMSGYRVGGNGENEITLEASIGTLKIFLAAELKPTREVLTAVRISGGKIEEVTSRDLDVIAAEKSDKEAKAAAVATPTKGCPIPAFERAELRANRVLRAFLDPEQLADFERYNRFVTIGADSGHQYQIRSRHSFDALEVSQSLRTLRDLTEGRDMCVHDWEVPAAEEMLALKLFLSLPEREQYIRDLPRE